MDKDQETMSETGSARDGAAGARGSWGVSSVEVTSSTAKYPDAVRDAARWLFYHCAEAGIRRSDAAELIGYSDTTVYRLMRGEYTGDLDAVATAIESYRRLSEKRQGVQQAGFVETSVAKRIWQVCDAALTYSSIACVWGDSQVGKTTALLEYQRRNNHGRTRYVRMPAAAGVGDVLRTVGAALALRVSTRGAGLRSQIMEAADRNTLLIVDELHQPFVSYRDDTRVRVLEFIREIHDRTGCGMVLSATNVARDEIEGGVHKRLLDQLNRRGIFRLQLPSSAPWPDRIAIARHYGLPEPEGKARELVESIVRGSGLKSFVSYLQAAGRLAARRRQAVCWDHFQAAHDVIARLSA